MTDIIVAIVISPDGTTRDFTDYDAALSHARSEHEASGGIFVVRDLRGPTPPRRPMKVFWANTVGMLIEELQKLDPNLHVAAWHTVARDREGPLPPASAVAGYLYEGWGPGGKTDALLLDGGEWRPNDGIRRS